MKTFFRRLRIKMAYLLIYAGVFLVAIGTLLLVIHRLNGITVDHESTNIPSEYEGQVSGTQGEVQYRYYLDVTPSMLGYSSSAGRMPAVAQAMLALNQERGGTFAYYTCGDTVSSVPASDFFAHMESNEKMTSYYAMAVENGTLGTMIENSDLSMIFTGQYSDSQSFNANDDMVNIIITDMNFLANQNDLESQTARLDRFSEQLSHYIADSNFCIYRIRSARTGPFTDEHNSNETQLTNRDDSFFIIVLARNERNFSQYLDHFEDLFEDNNIALAEKHRLQNDPIGQDQDIVLRDASGVLLDTVQNETQRTGLHWDNQSFQDLPDNAVGVRVVYENDTDNGEPRTSIRLPVTALSLYGYDEAAGDLTAGSTGEISTTIKIYQHMFTGSWREYTASPVTKNTAYLQNDGGSWYLYFYMELEKDLLPSEGLRPCLLIDVRFDLARPQYSIPAWVDAIHADGLPEGSGFPGKIGLRDFFERINAVKENAYESSANDGQGFLGNLFVLVNC